ncbi:protein of unknown function [Vibrio tapetis subsp. tapetis]|uniref:Uncharacterized protein n=1 Tax=Vibrio tapetis subsp. tapetis TaxID=1671868 RepID=A0A2N8ZIG1_9VIBR|nr:protein of unknown function [Vibrio tapetis subsp. tapetis]
MAEGVAQSCMGGSLKSNYWHHSYYAQLVQVTDSITLFTPQNQKQPIYGECRLLIGQLTKFLFLIMKFKPDFCYTLFFEN